MSSGDRCQYNADDCKPGVCLNGGQCLDGVNSFNCRCHPGFTGSKCEFDIDECAASPCENGGQCVNGVAQYQCLCRQGFTGW